MSRKVKQRMSDFNKIYPKTVAVKIFMNFSEKSKSFYSARESGLVVYGGGLARARGGETSRKWFFDFD